MIKDGAFSGIIDIESICFGDRLFFVALTQMALLTMKANLDYVEYIKQELNLNEMQKKVLNFYVLVFCVDFMSEKDIQFNKDDVPVVTEEEKKLLMEIFNQFDSYI